MYYGFHFFTINWWFVNFEGIFKETNPLVLELAFTHTHLGDKICMGNHMLLSVIWAQLHEVKMHLSEIKFHSSYEENL